MIGGGHNALVTAAYLGRAGLRTLVLERRERIGGTLVSEELAPGLRVPAVAHTIGRLLPSVIRRLRLGGHGLDLLRPPVRVFAPQVDGRSLTLWSDPGRTADELRAWSPRDAERYPSFERKVRSLASLLAYVRSSTPPDVEAVSWADTLNGLRLARALKRLGGPRQTREVFRVLPMPIADLLEEEFETDPLRAVLATRGIQYAALGPMSMGTAAVFLSDSAGNDGGAAGQTVFARGGPAVLAEALARAARSFGVEIREGVEVVRVTNRGERVSGVALESGEEFDAPTVVSGVDPKRTLLRLVDPVALGPHLLWRAGNLRLPGVVAKVNMALAGLPRFNGGDGSTGSVRLQGRIVVAPGVAALERAFDASKYGRVSDAPYIEATIPTLLDPTLAPAGQHALSAIVQYAPYHLRQGDWDGERERLGDIVTRRLEEYAPGLGNLVTARQVITPLDLEREYGLTEGHPLHGEPSLDQFFAWRPLLGYARYRLPLEGLYLCASGAHPGGGVTGAPGANAAREILRDRRRRL